MVSIMSGYLCRNDAYLGKIEGESLNSGNDYSTLYSFLQINLNNFSYFKGNDSMLEFCLY